MPLITHTADLSGVKTPLSNIRVTLSSSGQPYGFLFEYQDGTKVTGLDWYSGQSNQRVKKRDFSLADSESIILAFLYGHFTNGGHLLGIQFLTNSGRLSPVLGEARGFMRYTGDCREDGARPLAGLSHIGRSSDAGDDTLDWSELRFEWSIKKVVESRYLTASSEFMGVWKDDGGTAVNMLASIGDPTTARLSSIKVWSGTLIDALQFTYTNGSKSDKIGGNGGAEETFTLNTGEYIARIEARCNPELTGLTFVTNQRASKHYGGYQGDAKTFGPPVSAAVPMSLLAFGASTKDLIYGLLPIWAAADPVSSTLAIDDLDQSSPLQKKPVSVDSYEGTITNTGEGTIKKTMQWKYSTTKSTTITVNNWWSAKGTLKYTFKFSAKAKGGIPGAEAETNWEAGVEVALEAAGGQQFTNSETKSSTREQTITEEVTVGPGTAVRGIATWIQYAADDVVWRGTMTSKYADGTTKDVKVSGTLSGTNASKASTRYEKVPIEQAKK